jgi:hypothetical protein
MDLPCVTRRDRKGERERVGKSLAAEGQATVETKTGSEVGHGCPPVDFWVER